MIILSLIAIDFELRNFPEILEIYMSNGQLA